MVQRKNNKILLHACCAVCLGYSYVKLKELGYDDILVYFFNPNIYPFDEYERRKNELISFCENKNYKYLIEDGLEKDWLDYTKEFKDEPEKGKRCNLCFKYRLNQSAKKACEIGYSEFTTTLTISPHKISKNIFEIGEKIANKYNINFFKVDFKKENGFLKTNQIAYENNLYRQNYCGCRYSIR